MTEGELSGARASMGWADELDDLADPANPRPGESAATHAARLRAAEMVRARRVELEGPVETPTAVRMDDRTEAPAIRRRKR